MEIPKAGRDLDLLVSRRVLGKDVVNPSPYSTDLAEAWKVVERLRDLHKGWCEKHAACMPEAVKKFEAMSDEQRISYGDAEELANEMAGPEPFDFDVFFHRIHRSVDRRWPYSFLYVTPEVICRAAVAAFPPSASEAA